MAVEESNASESEPESPRRRPGFVAAGLRRLADFWATPGVGRAGICSPLVGVVAGLGAVAFLVSLQFMYAHVLGGLMHFGMPPTLEGEARAVSYPWPWWMVVLLPTLGGLFSGWLVFTYAPEAEGHGTDAMIRAFHKGGGLIRTRVPFIKTVASIVTIGTGGSAGQEGPIAQIGAGFGSYLARMLRLPASERRLLVLAGAAGGVGAIFRAPLGGALFAGEVLYASTAFEAAALLPCLASAIVAYSTFALFITPRPVFAMPPLMFQGLTDLPMYVGLTLLCAAVGWSYTRIFYGLRDRFFHPLPIPRKLKPALGGAMLGLLALAFPQVMAGGYGWVQWGAIGEPPELVVGGAAFEPNMTMGLLLAAALAKIVATGFTISSGGSGGVFGPSMFIGGMLGGAYGQFMHALGFGASIEPSAFVLVGMGGFFAGVSKTPLTSIVMVSEMTGSYSLLVPLMLACGLNVALSRRWTMYEEQVGSPIDSPAHQGDFVVDVLSRMKVKDAGVRTSGVETLDAATPFDRLVRKVASSSEGLFPVVDAEGRLTGVFTLRDLRLALLGSEAWGPLVIADDLATRPVLVVTVHDDLHTALRRMTELNTDEIPVVSPEDRTRLVGLLSRRSLTAAYTAMIESLRAGAASSGSPSKSEEG